MGAKTFIAAAVNSTDGTSRQFAGHSIGNASGKVNPKILVAVATTYLNDVAWSGTGVEITWSGLGSPITMDKLYMPRLAATSDVGVCGFFMCDHPGGAITTADITITCAGTKEGWGIATYILEDADYWLVTGRNGVGANNSPESVTLGHGSGDFLFALHQHGRTTDRYATFASGTGGAGPTTTVTMGRNSATSGVTVDGGGTMDTNTNTGARSRIAAIALRPVGDGTNPSALPAGDPYWSNVVLLLRPHDVYQAAASGISDESLSAHGSLTYTNNAASNNNVVMDGNASIIVDGTNDKWSLPDSNDWQLGATSADPWTIELRIVQTSAGGYILNQSQTGLYSWALTNAAGILGFIGYNGTTQWTITCSHTALVSGQRYEVAVDHDATGKVRVYLDGVMVGSGTPANSAIHNGTGLLYGGADLNNSQDWGGYFGGIRITKGVARYASDSGYTLGHNNHGGATPYPNYAPLDSIVSITPAFGSDAGGTAVTVIGLGFTGATDLLIDGNSCTSFVVVDDNTITAVTPAGTAGFVDVTVDRPTTDLTLVGGFEYISVSPPTFVSLSPDEGVVLGGTAVTLTGTDLTGATGAELNGIAVTSFTVVNNTTVTFVTPASTIDGLVDFELFHPYGDFTEVDAFDYLNVARVTQVPLLMVHLPIQAIRVTQVPALLVHLPIQSTRVTQIPVLPVIVPKPIPLPLPVVPEVPVREIWQWKTVVNIFEKGKEQRTALRGAPRMSQQFSAFVMDDTDYRDAYGMMLKYVSRVFNYPMYHYWSQMDAAASIGDTKLYFNPAYTDLRDGETIAFFDRLMTKTYFATIDTVDADGCTLAEPLTIDIPDHYFVSPAPQFRVALPTLAMSAIAGDFQLNLEGAQVRDVLRPDQVNSPTLIDGMLLLDIRPLADDTVNSQFDQNMVWLDNGIANPEARTSWYAPFLSGERKFLIHRPIGLDVWRAIAANLNGRQNPFLLPTFRNDLPIFETPALSATQFKTDSIQFFDIWRSKAWRYIRIQSDAGIIYRKINEVLANYSVTTGEPESLTVKIDGNIGGSTGANSNMIISFVNTCRLDSDEIVIDHGPADSVLSIKVRMVEE